MHLNEADTRAKLIDPKLYAAGWGEDRIRREHYVLQNHEFTYRFNHRHEFNLMDRVLETSF